MTPKWLNETVANFGKLLNLETLALNDAGVAGWRFENGTTFHIECVNEWLMFYLGLPLDLITVGKANRILSEAHPYFQTDLGRIRVGYLDKTQEVVLTLSFLIADADVTILDRAFHELWNRGERLRRALWD